MDFNELKEQVQNAPDLSDQFAPEDIQQTKGLAILAVIFPILFFLPAVAKPESGYGKFCANQILIYFVASIALNIANAILSAILGLIPFLGGILVFLIGLAIAAAEIAIWIFLIVNISQGKAKEIPFIGGLFKAFK